MIERIGTWWDPVGVIVGLDVRQRLRTTRWKITLAVAFGVISLVVFGSLYLTVAQGGAAFRSWSTNLYAVIMGIELFLGLALAPTLAATTINGDRKDATLALVQATPITHWQLAVGKLLGSWISCLALVAVASPYLLWGIVAAPYGFAPGVLGVIVLALMFLCYCGIGLGFSSLTARPAGSAVLTQATVFFLLLGLPAVFGVLYGTTSQQHRVTAAEYTYRADAVTGAIPDCRDVEEVRTFQHTERIWWLLAPNPFLVVPDVVAPHDNPRVTTWVGPEPPGQTVLAPIALALSTARVGPLVDGRTCDEQSTYRPDGLRTDTYGDAQRAHDSARVGHSWYLGLAANMVFGGLGLLAAARRLRVPAAALPRGVRVA